MESKESEYDKPEDLEGIDNQPSESWGDYPLDTVFVRKDQRTVGDIVSRIDKGRYKLDPEFQRDFVWNPTKQSRLIESSLMRIPLPVLYVAEDVDGKIIVVDGLQRLTTFHRYLNNEFALKDVGSSDPDSVISGKKFDDLPIHLQERIEDTQLTLYILDPKAPERARLDIFERVNSGEPLTRQQMRNCLYSGKSTKWLKEASQLQTFLDATGKSLKTKSMRDREVINRFCAFYILGFDSYKGDMEEYLADALVKMNEMDETRLNEITVLFTKSMALSFKLFGKHSFRKSLSKTNGDDSRSVLNIAFFDALASQLVLNANNLFELSDVQIKERISTLMKYSKFINAISYSTNNTYEVKVRHKLAKSVLKAGADVTADEIIYQDVLEQINFTRNVQLSSDDVVKISSSFFSQIEKTKHYVDWKERDDLQAEMKFDFLVMLDYKNFDEKTASQIYSSLMAQAIVLN
jgi:hypothetical protein